MTPELSRQHYAEHVNKPFYPALESFITASPVIAAVVEGLEAIRVVREMLGATSGLKAAAGTIRGDYSSSRQMNLVHASDGPEAARREIDLYFRPAEIHSYPPTVAPWLRAADEDKPGLARISTSRIFRKFMPYLFRISERTAGVQGTR